MKEKKIRISTDDAMSKSHVVSVEHLNDQKSLKKGKEDEDGSERDMLNDIEDLDGGIDASQAASGVSTKSQHQSTKKKSLRKSVSFEVSNQFGIQEIEESDSDSSEEAEKVDE